MRVEPLDEERLVDFVRYCLRHRKDVDESFLYDEDLTAFRPGDENPTYVLVDVRGELVGAASLILDEYRRRARAGRFRILHSEVASPEAHQALMQAMLRHTEGLDRLFVSFRSPTRVRPRWSKGFGLSVERYAFAFGEGKSWRFPRRLPRGLRGRPFVPEGMRSRV